MREERRRSGPGVSDTTHADTVATHASTSSRTCRRVNVFGHSGRAGGDNGAGGTFQGKTRRSAVTCHDGNAERWTVTQPAELAHPCPLPIEMRDAHYSTGQQLMRRKPAQPGRAVPVCAHGAATRALREEARLSPVGRGREASPRHSSSTGDRGNGQWCNGAGAGAAAGISTRKARNHRGKQT